jgi:hypothetical protein
MLRLGIGLVGLLFASVCLAGPWYGELGYLRSEGGLPDDTDQASIGFDTDNRDSGWKLTGGYELNRYVALEFGYADYGEQTLQAYHRGPGVSAEPDFTPPEFGTCGCWFNPFNRDVAGVVPSPYFAVPVPIAPDTEIETSLHTIPLTVIGQLEFNDWLALTLQGGALLSRYEYTTKTPAFRLVDGQAVHDVRKETETSSEAELVAGLGLLFSLDERFAVKLSWEKILDAGDEDTLEQNIDAYSLALRYRF